MKTDRSAWACLFVVALAGCPTRTVYDSDGGGGGKTAQGGSRGGGAAGGASGRGFESAGSGGGPAGGGAGARGSAGIDGGNGGGSAGIGGINAGTGGVNPGTGGNNTSAGGIGGVSPGTGGKANGSGGQGGGNNCTGACCRDSDCNACESCSAAHVCTRVANQADPSGQCAGTCDAAGSCKSKKGQSCTATVGGCIAGSICSADGNCCNQSCGTEATCRGTCAGRADGSCSYPTAVCGTASCSGTGFIDKGTCANGSCQMPAPAACPGGFACSGSACKTICSGNGDCIDPDYCSSGSCVPLKSSGQICSLSGQCASGICNGRCCNAGLPCTCPQPSTSNLLQNPGFDTSVAGWSIGTGPSNVTWRQNDVMSCPFSGALHIENATGSAASQTVSQCVSISSQTTYDFGVYMQSSAGYTHCDVDFFPVAGCLGDGVNQFDGIWLNVNWSNDMATNLSSGNYRSARVYCWAEAGVNLDIDMIYLTPSPGTY
jgi:hypothetical protein